MSEIPIQRMMRGQNNNATLFLLQRPQLHSQAAGDVAFSLGFSHPSSEQSSTEASIERNRAEHRGPLYNIR
jgi:hypothetical protein